MVYNRELKYVRQIVGRDMGNFVTHFLTAMGTCMSLPGITLTAWDNSCIQVFIMTGTS